MTWQRNEVIFSLVSFEHAAVVGDEDGGEREGDDQADEAEEGAPDGEGEEDDGGVEPHGLAHDARSEEHILDDLHDAEDGEGGKEETPEAAPLVGALDHGEGDGGYKANELEIRHHVEQTDEHAQADSHGEVDDEEADAEQHADAESDERLTAEVGAHATFDILGDAPAEVAVLGGDKFDPTLGDALVVEQDEEEIEQSGEDSEQSHEERDRAGDKVDELRERLAHALDDIVVLHERHPTVVGDILVDERLDSPTKFAVVGKFADIHQRDILEFHHLGNGGRDDEQEKTSEDGEDDEQADEDAQRATTEVATILEEAHHRIHHVGKNPRHEERNEHTAERAQQQSANHEATHPKGDTNETVESNSHCLEALAAASACS